MSLFLLKLRSVVRCKSILRHRRFQRSRYHSIKIYKCIVRPYYYKSLYSNKYYHHLSRSLFYVYSSSFGNKNKNEHKRGIKTNINDNYCKWWMGIVPMIALSSLFLSSSVIADSIWSWRKKKIHSSKLHDELQVLLNDMRLKRNFNTNKWIENKCKLLNDYMRKHKLSGCVINLSGGIDSAATLGLIKRASSMKNSSIKKIIAVSQPIHSSLWAENRAKEAAKVFDVELIVVDQTTIYNNLKALIDNVVGLGVGNGFAGGQLRSYMRTPSIYYIAQILSTNNIPSIVIGTGNKDEDGYLAYFCKAGDGVVDVQLISDLHKSQVFEVGEALNVPKTILTAKPSADLWDGQTDEDELGFTYDFIEFWTNFIEFDKEKQEKIKNQLSYDALKQLNEWGNKAKAIHHRNKHKLNSPYNIVCI